MTVYLLDAGIIVGFQKANHLDALTDASKRVALAIVEEVYDEVVTDAMPKHPSAAREAKERIDASRIAIRSLKVGSPEAATHALIRAGKTSATADLGESASVALAARDADITFVTNDAAACLLALQELRGRAMSFHPFLAMLLETSAISLDRCVAVARDVQGVREWRVKEPTWWVGWLKSRP